MSATRRDRIALGALGVVAVAYFVFYLSPRSAAPGPTGGGGDQTLESLLLDDPRPGPRQTPRVDAPPLLPSVTIDGDVVATLRSIDAYDSIGDPFAAFGRPPTTRAVGTPPRQMIVTRVAFDDRRTTHDQDHAVRIAGQPARTMRMPHLSGAAGPWTFATVFVDPSVKRVPVEVGVAVGPFVEFERISLGDAAPQRAAGASVDPPMQIESLEAGNGQIVVRLTVAPRENDAFAARSWLLQAVCRDGRVLGPTGYRPESAGGGRAIIRVDPKDVLYVVYHYRPYVWQSLGEVDVPTMKSMPAWPGRPSRPTTTIATSAPSPEVERRMRERRAAARASTAPS